MFLLPGSFSAPALAGGNAQRAGEAVAGQAGVLSLAARKDRRGRLRFPEKMESECRFVWRQKTP
jgi:hypothetical protein